MTGIGLFAMVSLEPRGTRILLAAQQTGTLSPAERAAHAIVSEAAQATTPEMQAGLLERLAKLIPVRRANCCDSADVAGLVAEIRIGAVLS